MVSRSWNHLILANAFAVVVIWGLFATGPATYFNVTSPEDVKSAPVNTFSIEGKHVRIGESVVVGADGHYITLRNNPNAVNPSWEELKAFLLRDNTDSLPYNNETFVCADFAEMVHNNAEAHGIRTAFVDVWMGSYCCFPDGVDHALNAFETTDRGLVYVDCTSSNQQGSDDKIVKVELEKEYVPRSIFPGSGWEAMWEKLGIRAWKTMGIVEEIRVIEW